MWWIQATLVWRLRRRRTGTALWSAPKKKNPALQGTQKALSPKATLVHWAPHNFKMTQILQCNIRGLLKNLDDIQKLLHKHTLTVVLRSTNTLKIETHQLRTQVHYFSKEPRWWDCMIQWCSNKKTAFTHLPLQTFLEAVAIQAVIFNKVVMICFLCWFAVLHCFAHDWLHSQALEFRDYLNSLITDRIDLGTNNKTVKIPATLV